MSDFAPVLRPLQQEEHACGPGVGAVAQSLAGERIKVLRESVLGAGPAEAICDRLGKLILSARPQTLDNEVSARAPDRAAIGFVVWYVELVTERNARVALSDEERREIGGNEGY